MAETDFLKLLGRRIVELRKARGMKQIDLATKLEMEDSSLRRIESGRINSTIGMLKKISEGFDISLSELLNFKY